jgi:hypothetical protein
MSILPSSAAVQERMRELREKEEQGIAKRQAEALEKSLQLEKEERERIEEVKRVVAASIVDWEAEVLLALEKIPNLLEMINKPPPYPVIRGNRFGYKSIHEGFQDRNASLYTQPFQITLFIALILHGFSEANIPANLILEYEKARFRLRIVARIIQETTATAEHIAAEEKAAAYEAWVRRRQAVLDRYADGIRSNMKTPYHSFTGEEFSNPFVMYVRYNVVSKILNMEYLRIDASDTKIEHSRVACPPTMKAPVAWNDMFEKGRLPFLTCCPVCSAQVSLGGIDPHGKVDGISCEKSWDHYRWHSTTNTHIKQNKPWDPRDPDGSIAAAAARDAKIVAKEAEIAKLQADLAILRRS